MIFGNPWFKLSDQGRSCLPLRCEMYWNVWSAGSCPRHFTENGARAPSFEPQSNISSDKNDAICSPTLLASTNTSEAKLPVPVVNTFFLGDHLCGDHALRTYASWEIPTGGVSVAMLAGGDAIDFRRRFDQTPKNAAEDVVLWKGPAEGSTSPWWNCGGLPCLLWQSSTWSQGQNLCQTVRTMLFQGAIQRTSMSRGRWFRALSTYGHGMPNTGCSKG